LRVLHTLSGVTKKPKSNKVRIARNVLIGVAIFGLGWAFGGGMISFRGYKSTEENASLPSRLNYSSVDTIYKSLKQNFDGSLDEQKLLDGLKKGLAEASGDQYTEYFNTNEAEEFNAELDGTFEGIGAELGKDENKNIIVVAPLAGFPAEKAGIKAKDIIAEIDDKSAYDISINEAVKQIRGKEGSEVKLLLVRDGKPVEVKVTRQKISVPSVTSEVKNGVGIIKISRFDDETAALAQSAAQSLKAQNVKGIVLDMRNNPGGRLDAAVGVSSLWLKDKVVLTERRGGQVVDTLKSRGVATLEGMKTVVLINGGSASASEITAGALKDNNAATLLGEKSFGKGSVQQPIDLKDGGILKVTVARWYTPAGKNIDKEGIAPDTEVKPAETDTAGGTDAQLDRAISEIQK